MPLADDVPEELLPDEFPDPDWAEEPGLFFEEEAELPEALPLELFFEKDVELEPKEEPPDLP